MAKRHKCISWGRRYLTLDRYMSGKFAYLFIWTFFISVATFVTIYFLIQFKVDWSLGEAFIQLTNPSTSGDGWDDADAWEWAAIVVTNLFGLVVLNGVILTLLVNWVSNRKERYEKGDARYKHIFRKRFAVIIGGHEIAASLARDLVANPDIDYVLIQTQREATAVRREIEAEVSDKNGMKRIVIYRGDRASWHELEELHLEKAQEIYIIGEPFHIDKTSHDSISMETWKLMNNRITKSGTTKLIPCHIMFEYQSTFSAFQHIDLQARDNRAFRFIPFNRYENWAQQVLISRKRSGNGDPYYMPLDGKSGLGYASDQRVHLIIAGMSKMGIALAIEAAHLAHYPNFNNPDIGNPRTLITFIDRNAQREMLFFMGRFRELFQLARWRYVTAPTDIVKPTDDTWDIYDTIDGIANRTNKRYSWHDPLKDEYFRSPYYGGFLGENLIDIDFEFIEGDVALPSIQKYISDSCADKKSKTTVAICFPIAVETMSAALYFETSVYKNVQQIWVRQPESGALADAIGTGLTGLDSAKFHVIRPFGMIGQSDYLRRTKSIAPKLVAYAYGLGKGTSLSEEYHKSKDLTTFLNRVESYWLGISRDKGKTSISKRLSNIYCANSFGSKVRSTGITVPMNTCLQDSAPIEILAKVEHNRWVIEQLLLGLRPVTKEYADRLPMDENDETRKELKRKGIHPDMISNEKLGETKRYDKEIAKIIPFVYYISEQVNNE